MEEWIKKSDAIKALRERWARTISYDGIGEDIGEECEKVIEAIPSVQVPPKPKGDVIGYRWVLKWDLKELWTGLR